MTAKWPFQWPILSKMLIFNRPLSMLNCIQPYVIEASDRPSSHKAMTELSWPHWQLVVLEIESIKTSLSILQISSKKVIFPKIDFNQNWFSRDRVGGFSRGLVVKPTECWCLHVQKGVSWRRHVRAQLKTFGTAIVWPSECDVNTCYQNTRPLLGAS